MIRDLGEVRPGGTIYVPFHTFDSNDPQASVTITGLATTDIEIYKDGSVTQRASDAGYTLLDTDGIDFDMRKASFGDMNNVFTASFSTEFIDNFIKSMDRTTVTMKFTEEDFLMMLEYPLGDEDFIHFVLAPKLN